MLSALTGALINNTVQFRFHIYILDTAIKSNRAATTTGPDIKQ